MYLPSDALHCLFPCCISPSGGSRPELQRLVFELDAPKPLTGAGSSSSTPSSGCCISRQRLLTRTLEFPCVNWDWHGQQHRHIYCCADTVNDNHHWGPTQSVLKVTFDNTAPQVSGGWAELPEERQVQIQIGRFRHMCR